MSEMLVLRTVYAEVWNSSKEAKAISEHLFELDDNEHVIHDSDGKEYFGFGCRYKVKSFEKWGDRYVNVFLSNDCYIEELSAEDVVIGDELDIADYYEKVQCNGFYTQECQGSSNTELFPRVRCQFKRN